jgi:hypothetical protein
MQNSKLLKLKEEEQSFLANNHGSSNVITKILPSCIRG